MTSMTEAEMWAGFDKSEEAGQLVYGTPEAREPTLEEQYDHGWIDLGMLGMPGMGRISASQQTALALVIMCADIMARDLSKADCLLYKRQRSRKGWDVVDPDDHPLAELLSTEPNEHMTWPEFWRMIGIHYGTVHNAYALKRIDPDGTPRELIPIMPARIHPIYSPRTGAKFWQIYAGGEGERLLLGDNYLVVPEERVIHFRGRIYDGVQGLSNAVVGGPLFMLANALAAYQTRLFAGDGKQPMVFEMDGQFGDEAAGKAAFNRLKGQLDRKVQRMHQTGEALLLEAGIKAKTVAISAKDGQASEAWTQQVMQICGLMQIPPHKIFALSGVAYNNMASMDRAYANDVMIPLARTLETRMRNSCLPRSEWSRFSTEFDRGQLLALDPDSLEKLLKTAMTNGLLTFDEGREYLPMRVNPLAKGGDKRMVPVNVALVSPDGTVEVAASGQNATQPGAGQEESPDNNAPGAGEEQQGEPEKGLRLVSDRRA